MCSRLTTSMFILLWAANGVFTQAYSSGASLFPRRQSRLSLLERSRVILSLSNDNEEESSTTLTNFDDILLNRYACTRFQRYDGMVDEDDAASPSDPAVVKLALESLDSARRAPSGFNAQPYKLVLVSTLEQKKALARYCIGHNAHRVRDSDCTAVFLADREAARTMRDYKSFVVSNSPQWKDRKWGMFKVQALITLFSSGYPLPRFLGVPISFGVRVAVSCLSVVTFRKVVVPTLSNAETWSTKNTMLVAMAYMLACTSRGVATCPMEGFNAGGIRRVLKIPRRYSIPIIVSTGRPYIRPQEVAVTETDTSDDMGMTHGSEGTKNSTPRYESNDVVFQDKFGESSTR